MLAKGRIVPASTGEAVSVLAEGRIVPASTGEPVSVLAKGKTVPRAPGEPFLCSRGGFGGGASGKMLYLSKRR